MLFALYRMGYTRVTGHGFRALASTTLNEHGWSPDVIERQLAHRSATRCAPPTTVPSTYPSAAR